MKFTLKNRRKRLIVTVTAVLLAAGIIIAAGQSNRAEVRLHTVKKGDIKEYVELRGKVELERKEKIYSRLSGVIGSINAREGDRVDVKTQLAQLDVEDLDLALNKAQAAYEAALANLEDLRNSIKPEQIRQAEARVEQAESAVKAAQADYDLKKGKLEKTRLLLESGAASKEDMKDLEALVAAAESAFLSARHSYDIAVQDLEMLKKGVSQDAIAAAEANVEQAKLQMEELKNNLGRAYIYPGLNGIVLSRFIEKGEFVQPGMPLYEIGDYNSAYIRVDVLSDDAGKINIGHKAIISGEAIGDKKISGEVFYIAPKAESRVSSLGVEQQRVEMRIRFDNSRHTLKPGYGVDVDIITKEKQSAVYVPYKAVFDSGGGDSVFVVNNGKLELRTVRTGIENDDYMEILEGLTEGEKVVVDPGSSLKPGIRVREK